MSKDTIQTETQTALGTLLDEYKPIYEKHVYGKNKWLAIIRKTARIVQRGSIMLFIGAPLTALLFPTLATAAAINSVIAGVLIVGSTIARILSGWAVEKRTEDSVSPEQIRKFLDKKHFCNISQQNVAYSTFAQRSGDTATIRLLAEDQPSFLISLRGAHGPVTKHDLVQKFALIEEDGKQPSGPYPGITYRQYQDFPKRVTLTHLNIHMFPYTFRLNHGEHSPWCFMIPNTDAYREIQEAFELLCDTIEQGIVMDELINAIKNDQLITGYFGTPDAAYDEDKIIAYLTGKPSGTNADTINDLVDKIEAVVTDENALPSAKADAIETLNAIPSDEV